VCEEFGGLFLPESEWFKRRLSDLEEKFNAL
jgi:hypothetical protein